MGTVNLNNDPEQIITEKDSIVIVENFESIRGGRSLDVTGYPEDVIKAGHVIIKETSTGNHKPMPLSVSGAIVSLGSITGGSSYVNGTYTGVALTGGSGTGATADIVVAGGAVTSVTIVNKGTGYKDGNQLSASSTNLGGAGSGFAIPVTEVDNTGTAYASLPGSHEYVGILIASIPTKQAFAGIMVRGTVNPNATPFSMTSILSAFKTATENRIAFRAD